METRVKKSNEKRQRTEKVRHCRDDALSETELQELLKASEDIFEELYIVSAGYQGMRESEIAHMTGKWINFQDKTITIPPEQECKCGYCMKKKQGVWTPKTGAGARTLPIREKALPIFERFFKAYHKVGVSRQTIFNHIIDVAKKSGLTKKVYPHSLRATAGTLWVGMGVSPSTLKYLMGWELIVTSNNYIGADSKSALRDARWCEGNQSGRQGA